MIKIIIGFLLVLVFYCLPFWLKIIITVINSIVPDTIPVIDELVMTSGTFAHFFRFIKATQFAEDHPVLTKILLTIVVLIILVIIAVIIYYLYSQGQI